VVELVRGVVGLGHQVRPGVVAEHEAHALVVPAVELGREREVGVAPQQYVAKGSTLCTIDVPT
jgi:hypothetical protein